MDRDPLSDVVARVAGLPSNCSRNIGVARADAPGNPDTERGSGIRDCDGVPVAQGETGRGHDFQARPAEFVLNPLVNFRRDRPHPVCLVREGVQLIGLMSR